MLALRSNPLLAVEELHFAKQGSLDSGEFCTHVVKIAKRCKFPNPVAEERAARDTIFLGMNTLWAMDKAINFMNEEEFLISWAPRVLSSWGRSFSLGVHCVMSYNGEAMLSDCGVTLYSYRPEIHGFPSLPALSINFLATPTILSQTIRSWMVRAVGVVCDVVTLQKLLEFLRIVAWSVVTSDDVG